MRKSILFFIIALITVVSSFASNNSEATSQEVTKTAVDYYINSDPQTLDPQQCWGVTGFQMMNFYLEGLVRAGQEEGSVIPGHAESWSFDEASNSWTFVLRDNAVWMDGSKITTDDYFFAWKIALDTHAAYSFLMTEFIEGASEFSAYSKKSYITELEGELEKEALSARVDSMTDAETADYDAKKAELWKKVGVSAVGNKLTVKLIAPVPFFPYLTTMSVFAPVSETFYDSRQEAGDYVLEVAGINANGPWIMSEWVHDDYVKFVRNEKYWNTDAIQIDEVNLKMIKDVETRTNLLKTDALDGSAIQAKDIPDFEDVANLDQYNLQEMVNKPDFSTFYTEVNHFSNPLTQNVDFRKALAYAMDRKSFVEKINIGDTPGYGLVPTFFPGYQKSFREEVGVKLFQDNNLALAKEHLAKAKATLGIEGEPEIDMLTGDSDIAQKIAEKFQADWAEAGIKVNLVPLPWGERLKRLKAGDFAMASSGWGPDYPDPMTYLELFQTGNGSNKGQYSNPAYDELIIKAKAEANAKVRMGYMWDAERILLDDMAVIPQYYRTGHRTFKNYLTGVVERGIGAPVDFYWAKIDMAAKIKDKE